MYYKKLDDDANFLGVYARDWIKSARELGFRYISEAIIGLYLGGDSTREIEEKMGLSNMTVRRLLKKWGIEMRSRGGAHGGRLYKYKDYVDQDLDTYPMTTIEIGEELGLSTTRVQQILDKALRDFRENWIAMFGPMTFELTDIEKFSGMIGHEQEKGKFGKK